MSDHYTVLYEFWKKQMEFEYTREPLIYLDDGRFTISHYKGYLLETYFHAGLNPQLQAFCTMYFPGNPRELVKKFLLHASSEIAHDLLAKEDLLNLGVSPDFIAQQKPLPITNALLGHTAYSIQFKSFLFYLGYLYHLEVAPTTFGEKYNKVLRSIGVNQNAINFLSEHATVDVGHNKLMKDYLDFFIKSKKDLEMVELGIYETCNLHSKMVAEAFLNGEKIFGK